MARGTSRDKDVSVRRARRGVWLMMFGGIMVGLPLLIGIFGYTGKVVVATMNVLPPFDHTILFIDHDNVTGAVGIILNRPMTEEQHARLPAYIRDAHIPVGYGGPLESEHIVVIEEKTDAAGQKSYEADDWDQVVQETPDILARIQADAASHGQHYRVFAGLAGWGMLQLEHEIIDGEAWLPTEPTHDIMFQSSPAAAWDQLYPALKARQDEQNTPKKSPKQT